MILDLRFGFSVKNCTIYQILGSVALEYASVVEKIGITIGGRGADLSSFYSKSKADSPVQRPRLQRMRNAKAIHSPGVMAKPMPEGEGDTPG